MRNTVVLSRAFCCAVHGCSAKAPALATPRHHGVLSNRAGAAASPGGSPNVFFHTQKMGGKVTTGYIAIADTTKPVTGAPYTATADHRDHAGPR